MHEYDDAVLKCFVDNQLQLFPEEVADTLEEAESFLGRGDGSCSRICRRGY